MHAAGDHHPDGGDLHHGPADACGYKDIGAFPATEFQPFVLNGPSLPPVADFDRVRVAVLDAWSLVMNQMGHEFPNMLGVDARGLDEKAPSLLPHYMTMGQDGMGTMGMAVPKNSIPMVGAEGPSTTSRWAECSRL